jgi:hypothetical protein
MLLTLELLGLGGVRGFGRRGAAGGAEPVAGGDPREDGSEAEGVVPAVAPVAQHQLRARVP